MDTVSTKWWNRCENHCRYCVTALNRNEYNNSLNEMVCKCARCENASINVSCTGKSKKTAQDLRATFSVANNKKKVDSRGFNKQNTCCHLLWWKHGFELDNERYVSRRRRLTFTEQLMQVSVTTNASRRQVTNDCQQFSVQCTVTSWPQCQLLPNTIRRD